MEGTGSWYALCVCFCMRFSCQPLALLVSKEVPIAATFAHRAALKRRGLDQGASLW